MNKLTIIIVTVLISVLMASIYGVIHDQVTYTISPEYYTQFKFIQFNLPDYIIKNERLGVAIVGIGATWWTGIPVGLIVGAYGFWYKSSFFALKLKVTTLLVVTVITIITGIVGSIHGFLEIESIKDWPINIGGRELSYFKTSESLFVIKDVHSFILVGYIHNYSYIGGLIGLITSCFYQHKKLIVSNKNFNE